MLSSNIDIRWMTKSINPFDPPLQLYMHVRQKILLLFLLTNCSIEWYPCVSLILFYKFLQILTADCDLAKLISHISVLFYFVCSLLNLCAIDITKTGRRETRAMRLNMLWILCECTKAIHKFQVSVWSLDSLLEIAIYWKLNASQ